MVQSAAEDSRRLETRISVQTQASPQHNSTRCHTRFRATMETRIAGRPAAGFCRPHTCHHVRTSWQGASLAAGTGHRNLTLWGLLQAQPQAHRRHGALQVVCAETSRRSSSTVTKKRAGAPPLPPIDDEASPAARLAASGGLLCC